LIGYMTMIAYKLGITRKRFEWKSWISVWDALKDPQHNVAFDAEE